MQLRVWKPYQGKGLTSHLFLTFTATYVGRQIKSALDDVEMYTCLKFVEITGKDPEYWIKFYSAKACGSAIGRIRGFGSVSSFFLNETTTLY